MRGEFGIFPNNFESECTIDILEDMSAQKLRMVLLDCESNVIVKGVEGVVQYVFTILLSSDICVIDIPCVKNRIDFE